MAKAPPTPHHTPEPQLWSVTGRHLDTLNAIVDGLALIHSILGKDADPGIPLHILAEDYPETRDLVSPVSVLAETLVEAASNAHVDAAREAERSAAIDDVKAAIEREHFRTTRRARKDALSDAARLIQEIGLERHDLRCVLATDHDERSAIVVDRVPSSVADAWLIETLFQRMEAFVAADENLAVERDASAWFFECWSDDASADDSAYTDFSRMIREQEWSLVSRDTLSLDEPVVSSFTIDQARDDVPPRQQRLATAYAQSTVGIFEVMAVDGPTVTVRDVGNGQTHRYHEHNEDAKPYPGLLILGRMLRVEDDLWLRSPGAIIISSVADDYSAFLSKTLTTFSEDLPTPIALEALISLSVYQATVPVSRLPVPTIAAAHDALAAVDGMLEAIGVFDDEDDDNLLTESVEQRDAAEQERFEQRVDQALGAFIGALNDQIELDSPRPAAQPAKRKKPPRAKQQPTRRRKR
jgi:hypothetical protein